MFRSFKSRVLLVALVLSGPFVQAQCAMCRAALEAGGDTAQAEAVNDGIVYLMAVPYILVGIIGVAIYRSRKKLKTGE